MAVTIEEMREQLLINSESLVRLEGNINTLDTKLNGKVELLDEKIKTLTDRIDTVVKNTSDGKNTRRTWSIALIAAAPGILMIIIEIIKLFNPG